MSWDHRQSVKEVIKHLGFVLGAERILYEHRQRQGLVTAHLDRGSVRERFQSAYRLGSWVHSNEQLSLSGRGSETAATGHLRERLPSLLTRLGCRRLLDIGCGDWNWMRNVQLRCDYLGVDIVPEIIEANRAHERPGVRFEVADAIAGPLPQADVALCREVLFHLSFHDGCAALANVRAAAPWLIVTTDPTLWFNSDIRTGDYRKLNLQRAPYRLPPPHEVIADDAVSRVACSGCGRLPTCRPEGMAIVTTNQPTPAILDTPEGASYRSGYGSAAPHEANCGPGPPRGPGPCRSSPRLPGACP